MAELFDFQRRSVAQLLVGKHIIVSGCGCLAEDTPIPLADGTIKPVQDIEPGDMLLSYNENSEEFISNEVEQVIRTCHKPKPMLQFKYGNETITTTYDHPFFNGEGYYPLYQLIWGEMETSERIQLKLLCEQYGQDFNDKAIWCKHCGSNEAVIGRQWLLQNNDGREDCQSPQDSSRELVGQPQQIGMCKPFELQEGGQSSREPRVVFEKIQCLVRNGSRGDKSSTEQTPTEWAKGNRKGIHKEVLLREHSNKENLAGEEEALRRTPTKIPKNEQRQNTGSRRWEIKTLEARPYYTLSMRTAPYTYCIGREHYYITHNSGKIAMAMVWAELKCKETGKGKVLVVTTASKCHARTAEGLNDFEADARLFCSPSFSKSLSSSLSLISWHKLSAWVNTNWNSLEDYVVIFDELQKAGAGVSSGMGKAFLKLTKRNPDWTGFTGTPGDTWLKFYPYFTACNLVRNKTSFMNEYANVQTFKGYPEIVGWRNEDKLKDMWATISFAPDTSKVMNELPSETHKTVSFKKPSAYNKIIKTRYNEAGEFLDTSGALCAELRRQCFTKDKKEWIKDFVEGLESGCVFFYNFIKTGDELEHIIEKVLPKGAKLWRIDGSHHEAPTVDTLGKNDMVLCQWQSGSEGLNLQGLHYMVIVEACYSYSTSIQGRGRIRRVGQKMPQFYYYLKTEGTIEDAVYKALRTKSDFAQDIWCMKEGIADGAG